MTPVPNPIYAPKWKSRILKDDYFGDVKWYVCSACKIKECWCDCATPHGLCRNGTLTPSAPATPAPCPLPRARCSDCAFTDTHEKYKLHGDACEHMTFHCGKTGSSTLLHAPACANFTPHPSRKVR